MSAPEQPPKPPDKPALPGLAQDIEQAAQKEIAAGQPDELAHVAEISTLEVDQLKIKVEQLQNELDEAKDLHKIRKAYIDKLFGLIVIWLSIVIAFLCFEA